MLYQHFALHLIVFIRRTTGFEHIFILRFSETQYSSYTCIEYRENAVINVARNGLRALPRYVYRAIFDVLYTRSHKTTFYELRHSQNASKSKQKQAKASNNASKSKQKQAKSIKSNQKTITKNYYKKNYNKKL